MCPYDGFGNLPAVPEFFSDERLDLFDMFFLFLAFNWYNCRMKGG